MDKFKNITPLQYSWAKGCSVQNIVKQLKKSTPLEDVVEVERHCRFYILKVSIGLYVPDKDPLLRKRYRKDANGNNIFPRGKNIK